MRSMTLLKLVKLFVLQVSPTHYRTDTTSSTDTPCPPEVERLVTTVSVISETTNSNSLLPSTASNDIQQHVNSAISGRATLTAL